MRRSTLIVLALVSVAAVGSAGSALLVTGCNGDTIKAPTSDKNFDDPDEPSQGGTIGAQDATTQPQDAGDSAVEIPVCDGAPSCELDAAADAPADAGGD